MARGSTQSDQEAEAAAENRLLQTHGNGTLPTGGASWKSHRGPNSRARDSSEAISKMWAAKGKEARARGPRRTPEGKAWPWPALDCHLPLGSGDEPGLVDYGILTKSPA